MHRSTLRRVLITLWACWFVLLVNEPLLLHACPMHDGVPAVAVGTPVVPADAPHESAHRSHANSHVNSHANSHAQGASVESTPEPAQHDDGGGHHCTCLGHCASASAIALPEGKSFAWLAGVVDIDAVPVVPAREVARDVEHFLPFATAPPGVTRA